MSIKDSADKVLMNLTTLEYGFRLLEEDEDFRFLLSTNENLKELVELGKRVRVAIGGEVTGMSSMANASQEEISRFVESQMADRIRAEPIEFETDGEVV